MRRKLFVGLMLLAMCLGLVLPFGVSVEAQDPILKFGRGVAYSLAWRPDGNAIAVGGNKGIRLYSPSFQDMRFLDGITGESVVWSPNGKLLAVVGEKWVEPAQENHGQLVPTGWSSRREKYEARFLAIVDVETGKVIDLVEGADMSSILAWSPDSARLAGVGLGASYVSVWAATGEEQQKIELPADCVFQGGLAWQPHGASLAIGGEAICLWDLQTNTLVAKLPDIQGVEAVGALAWSPSGERLAVARDSYTEIWDIPANNLRSKFENLRGRPDFLDWSADGTRLAISGNGLVQIADLSIRKTRTLFETKVKSPHNPISWYSSRERLATIYDGIVQIWDTKAFTLIDGLYLYASAGKFLWSRDGKHIVTRSAGLSDIGHFRVWDVATGKLLEVRQITFDVRFPLLWQPTLNDVAWTRDGAKVAVAGPKHGIQIWSKGATQPLLTLAKRSSAVGWSADGHFLAIDDGPGDASIWVPLDQSIMTLTGINQFAWCVRDGRFAIASRDGLVIGDARTRTTLRTLALPEGLPDALGELVWSPDCAKLLAHIDYATLPDGRLSPVIWDTENGRVLWETIPVRTQIAWRPDADLLAGLNNAHDEIWFFSLSAQCIVDRLSLDDQTKMDFTDIQWNLDGNMLAALGEDGLVYLWQYRSRPTTCS